MRKLFVLAWLGIVLLLLPAAAWAGGSSFQTSLVPDMADTEPGFRANGSSIKIVSSGNLRVKGKLKGVVDDEGDPVTTERNDDGDDYCVEIDLFVPATEEEDTLALCFDLKKGNGSFKGRLGGGPAFAGAQRGDGVTIREIRVLDGDGTVIGSGGVALRN